MSSRLKRVICRPYKKGGTLHVELTFEAHDGKKSTVDKVYGHNAYRFPLNLPGQSIDCVVYTKRSTQKLMVMVRFNHQDGTNQKIDEEFDKGPYICEFTGGLN